jgi:RHS repeat-associated protein
MKSENLFILCFLSLILIGASLLITNISYDKIGHVITPALQETGSQSESQPLIQAKAGSATIVKKTYIYAGNLLATSSTDETGISYYIQDNLGSNMKVVKGVLEKQTNKYYAFGETTSTGDTENKYKYTGKELDDETGLYYYGARYYNPNIGRFLQADALSGTLQDPLSLNKYAYVNNNPLKYIDPTGNGDQPADATYTSTTTDYLKAEQKKKDDEQKRKEDAKQKAEQAKSSHLSRAQVHAATQGLMAFFMVLGAANPEMSESSEGEMAGSEEAVVEGTEVAVVTEEVSTSEAATSGLVATTESTGSTVMESSAAIVKPYKGPSTIVVEDMEGASAVLKKNGWKIVSSNEAKPLPQQTTESGAVERLKLKPGEFKDDTNMQLKEDGWIARNHDPRGSHATEPHLNGLDQNGNKIVIVVKKPGK